MAYAAHPNPCSEASLTRIPLCIPSVGAAEARNLEACIATGMVSYSGAFVDELERRVADVTGAKRAVATSAGTTALHAGLIALGVSPGDLVIVPTLTFVATANAVSHCAATPWLLDCEATSWMLDGGVLEEALHAECERTGAGGIIHRPTGRRVAAVIPVHMLGLAADLDAICDVAEAWGLPVLADAAAALGTRYKGRGIGETRATLSAISFNANKIITTGGGGALIGNNTEQMDFLAHITTTARVRPGYLHDRVAFNYRMTNLQAAVGVAQIERLPEFLAAKARIAARYGEAFADLPGVRHFPRVTWSESNCWLSGIFVEGRPNRTVADLRARLAASAIEAPPFWMPMHLQPPYANAPRRLTGAADEIWERILPLPCSISLLPEEQERVIALVREHFFASDSNIP